MEFKIVPVPLRISEEARKTRKAPGYGHPVHCDLATGYGPCRSCLQPFATGLERRLLFTFDPFFDHESLPLPGSVYVHAEACPVYEEEDRFPDSLRFIPMTFNGYSRGRVLRQVEYVEAQGDADGAIRNLFQRNTVDYIHVRNTEAGCFMSRIDQG